MISVLVKKSNEVVGFEDGTSVDQINAAINGDLNGTISEHKPSFYERTVQPALKAIGANAAEPRFITDIKPTPERAFVTSLARGATADIIKPDFSDKEAAAYPVQAYAGNLAGALIGLKGVGTVLNALKLPAFTTYATKLVTDRMGAGKMADFVSKAIPSAISNAAAGGTYAGIHETANQVRDEEHPDLAKIGTAVLHDALWWGGIGALTGPASKPVGIATATGLGYLMVKADGGSETDALLNGAVLGGFHLLSAHGDQADVRDFVTKQVEQNVGDYVMAKNPIMHEQVARQTAREWIQLKAEEVLSHVDIQTSPEQTSTMVNALAKVKEKPETTKALLEGISNDLFKVESTKVPAGSEASLKPENSLTSLKVSEPAKTPQEFIQRIEQLNKFAQSRAILRKGASMKTAAGMFIGLPKEGEIKLDQKTLSSDKEYMATLAHELGHALEFNVVGKTNAAKFKFFGENLDAKTVKTLRDELTAVTKELVGQATIDSNPEYYNKPAELLARYFEKMFVSPGNLEELAPTATKLLEAQALKHPIIQEFLDAARSNIDKGAPKNVLLRDARETYHKYLGKRAGDMAYNEELAYRAMKERGKIIIEKFLKDKFKGVKDAPEQLFRAAEAIKVTKNGISEFGTRDFLTARSVEDEVKFKKMGYEKIDRPVVEDGKAFPQYAKWRYTPEQAKEIFKNLSPEGKQIIEDFTAAREEAKDYFNREIIKDVNNVQGNIEGWVHHYFEEGRGSTVAGGQKFKNKKAGTRQQRTGTEGYVEDLKSAMTKAMVDLEGEKVFNDFIKRQFARVTKPIAESKDPESGWVEVAGTLKSGVGLPQEKRAVVIDEAGQSVPLKQARYQMPKDIYERYKLWRGLVDEASTAVKIVNDINRYWRINILTHPGTVMTNVISGGVQYSSKILTDFYREVLTGDLKMPQTKANVSALVKVLLPKGWADAPDWVYGGDLSNFYGQFMKQKSPVSKALDTYGDHALKAFGLAERYWKKVILTSENVSKLDSLNEMTKEGLRLPTEDERNLIAALNKSADLYAYDYDNVPRWLEEHQKSVVGQAVKPFAKYPYKYAKQIMDMVGSAFDQTQPWQSRVAKLMALTTIAGAYAAISNERKKEQKTPAAELDLNIPARMQTRGRLMVGKDEKGQELFMRVSKYPFIGLTEAGMQLVDGNFEGGKDAIADMIGSIGPVAQIGLLALNFRNKFQTFDSVPVIIGDSLSTFVPFSRILNDVSRAMDPFQRKQETFIQTFTKMVPTTDVDLQKKLHGKIRSERVPTEGNIRGAKRGRETVDVQLKNYKQDVLLALLSGIYMTRIDPDKVNAYIIRAEKNKKEREIKEKKEGAKK